MKGEKRYHKLLGLIVLSIFNFQFSILHALPVEGVGVATQVLDGKDTVLIFRDEIHLKTSDGQPVDWYKGDGSLYASGVNEIYPDEGCFRVGGSHFCVQLYKGIDDLAFTVETGCENTIVRVTGDIGSRAHTYSLSYNALAWNTEEWVDSATQETGDLMNTILLPPLYGPTPLTLCYDPEIRSALGLDSACVEVEVPLDSIKAVKMELTSLATAREDDPHGNNERNRPTSQTLITGSEYSGPLEVAFFSNPTPGAKYYAWVIYKSTERIITRNDRDIRYTFSEPGAYRVVCAVNNENCSSDSSEVAVQISESYLAVPNVFTPNGDGKNDEFRVAYRSLREFHGWVYNRWGKLVFEWTDPAKGWDGNINGQPAAVGAYYYVIRALGTDAAKNARYMSKISYTKKKLGADESVIGIYQLSGDINLLR